MITVSCFVKQLRQLTRVNRFCIALSGGLDSSVLLHLLDQARKIHPEIELRAIHVNHGVSQHAENWSSHAAKICNQYHIPIQCAHLDFNRKNGESLEAALRQRRYKVFSDHLQHDEILVTAHHQNDQAETLLLQLIRGAGPKGLAAMPAVTPFGKGFLVRPLLSITRDQLEKYALAHALAWIEDDSNEDLQFDRNFVRKKLLPEILERWPAAIQNISRSAKHCAETDEFVECQVIPYFQELFDPINRTLRISGILKLNDKLQNHVIRYWMAYLNLQLPSTCKLQLIKDEVLKSRHDALPHLQYGHVILRRYGDEIYALPSQPKHDPKQILYWDLQQDFVLPNNLGVLKVNDFEHRGLDEITIRFRQGGERCKLPGRKHSHSLKKLFQEWKIPPWQRDRIPLLYLQDQLLAIVGYARCEINAPSP